MKRFAFLVMTAVLLMTVSCGGKDGPTDPGGNGNGNGGEQTLISGANESSWDFEKKNYDGSVWESGAFRMYVTPVGSQCTKPCGECYARSAQRIDFTPYSATRLKCRVRLETDGSDSRNELKIHVLPNVPGTEGIFVYWEAGYGGVKTIDEILDVSLENARSFREATIQLWYEAEAGDYPTAGDCSDFALVEVSDFRIVATK